MASVTISGSNDWSGHSANRILTATVSADAGSGTASYTVSSTYTYRNGSYTRVRLDINGQKVFDTGYAKNFSKFPCKKNSTKSGTFSIPTSGNISVRLRGGVSHDNLTDIDVSGTLVRINPPSYNSINASSITRTSAYLSASINTNGGGLTGGGWDVSTNGGNTWSYYDGGPTGRTVSGLTPNTTYWYRGYAVNAAGGVNSGWGSFTTSGNAPVINSITPSPGRTTCSLANNSISYDTNASFSSVSVRYGTSTSYGSTASSTSLSGLSPNTTYYYSMTVKDNYGRTSNAKTGSFRTTCNKPNSLNLTFDSGTELINVRVSANGDTNAPITNYTLYYRRGTSGNYISINYGTNTMRTVSELDSDTDYQFYFTATNAGGTTTSRTVIHSTLLNHPSINSPTVSNLLPFSCTISANASISPSRTLNYRFSKDDGATWTTWQSSNTYNWVGLAEETTYRMKVQVKALHVSANAYDTTTTSSTLIVITPADQARVRIKKTGNWQKGKVYYKKNGQWVKAKKVYIKVNGQWKVNSNN